MKSPINVVFAFVALLFAGMAFAQDETARMIGAPDRGADEGGGPYGRLIIRGATLIDGTGAPPIGPVDIVIENNRIVDVKSVGYPGLEIDEDRRPTDATREIDAHGQYVMPGIIDMHTHTGGSDQSAGGRVQLQAMDGSWHHHGARCAQRRPGVFACRKKNAARKTRSLRREFSPITRSAPGRNMRTSKF